MIVVYPTLQLIVFIYNFIKQPPKTLILKTQIIFFKNVIKTLPLCI